MPLIALDHVSTAFGHLPLLDDAGLVIEPGERVAIIGRNGTGKSTLLRILSGEMQPDKGSIWRDPALVSARLEQDVPLATDKSVFDVVAEGLGDLAAVVSGYHHAAIEVAEDATPERLDALGRWQHELEERDGWTLEQRVELVLTRLDLQADACVDTLSGGWRRRVLLARALVAQPSLLLLDEPTNHLDLEAILWLETFLMDYPGAIVFVTHDRTFLQRLATRIVELDRGMLTSWPGDYETFIEKKDAWLANEEQEHDKFDKKMAQEEVWLRRGVKARRTRDEGRVKALMAMRQARMQRRARVGNVKLAVDAADRSGHVVIEAEDVSKSYDGVPVVKDFSARIMRSDRIGLIGPNGAGKTTLLRLLVGDLKPDSGEIQVGTNVQVAYFDQQREQLDPEKTVADTVADGNDTVTINGQTRHVHGYLADYLFPPERARSPVKALSGGERNRLLLARLLTRPANVLVLDEPTNDLDLETLELLEAQLVEFPGTLLIVSHDRRFLNNVVTSTMVFEGGGRVQEYVGGYDDWVQQRDAGPAQFAAPPVSKPAALKPAVAQVAPAVASNANAKAGKSSKRAEASSKAATVTAPTKSMAPVLKKGAAPAPGRAGAPAAKLTFGERKELDAFPARIAALEAEHTRLQAEVASPEFYKSGADAIKITLARIEALALELNTAYERWDALESKTR